MMCLTVLWHFCNDDDPFGKSSKIVILCVFVILRVGTFVKK